jgi:hypothetical protein
VERLHAGEGDAGWRGFIDFAGKSRRAVQDIEWRDDSQVTFTVDVDGRDAPGGFR